MKGDIYNFFPWSYGGERNLGKAYNKHMALLPSDEDWGVIKDGDVIFLTFNWGDIIEQAIKDNPDAGIISCYTNRIAKRKQQLYEIDSPNILVHRLQAKKFDKQFNGSYKKIAENISGFLMIIKKKTWLEAGKFQEIDNCILDIDGLFSRKVRNLKKSIILMRGMYVFHYYRMAEGAKYKDHLRNAKETLSRIVVKKRSPQANKSLRNENIIKARRKQRSTITEVQKKTEIQKSEVQITESQRIKAQRIRINKIEAQKIKDKNIETIRIKAKRKKELNKNRHHERSLHISHI